jgi:hypothetical protein
MSKPEDCSALVGREIKLDEGCARWERILALPTKGKGQPARKGDLSVGAESDAPTSEGEVNSEAPAWPWSFRRRTPDPAGQELGIDEEGEHRFGGRLYEEVAFYDACL